MHTFLAQTRYFLLCGFLSLSIPCQGAVPFYPTTLKEDIKTDFRTYFARDNLMLVGGVLAAGGIFANTGLDNAIRNHWQTDFRSDRTNRFFRFPDWATRSPAPMAVLVFGSMALGSRLSQTEGTAGPVLYHWGYRSLRTFLLGIAHLPLSHVLGSGRPIRHDPSHWQPFKHKNSISGHTFYGAVPFITAAMMTDPPLLRYSLYALSTISGLARINQDAHYFSQVLLGWSFSYLCARSVYQADEQSSQSTPLRVSLLPDRQGVRLTASLAF